MSTSRSSSRTLTTLPLIKSKNRSKSRDEPDTMITQISPLPELHLPSINDKAVLTNDNAGDGQRSSLLQKYKDLLKVQKKNETLIKEKEKELEEQQKELDMLLKKAEEERGATEELTREHAKYVKMLKNFELENKRVKTRQSKQAFKVSLLAEKNKELQEELRFWLYKVNDIENRIEHGPAYIREQIEKYIKLTKELETENEKVDSKLNKKMKELYDLRIDMMLKEVRDDSDDENDASKNKIDETNENKVSGIIKRLATNRNTITTSTNALNLGLSGMKGHHSHGHLSAIRQTETSRKIQKNYTRSANPRASVSEIRSMKHKIRPVAPSNAPGSIHAAKCTSSSVTPSNCTRNDLHRGTSLSAGVSSKPKPSYSGSQPTKMTSRTRRTLKR